MCGRAYHTYTDEELELRYLNERRKDSPIAGLKPNYNLCPTQLTPVVFIRNGKRTIEQFRFGLVPFWAKDVKSAAKYSLINAKSEEVQEKRSYKQAFENRRCIVPLTGFFEWKRESNGPKRPFDIHLKGRKIMSVAGVWEHWESKDTDEVVESFSILTVGPNELMKEIHNRMPVILSKQDETQWLDPENKNIESLKKVLTPYSSKEMEAIEISSLVNSPRNNRPEVLQPISV